MGGSDEVKKTLRSLKRLEVKLRFGGDAPAGKGALVWESFFDLHEMPLGHAKYTLRELAAMPPGRFHSVVDEFFYIVYDRLYRELVIVDLPVYDIGLLVRLGLPPDADAAAVKQRFHALAKQYHPDTGGDAAKFIELMHHYRALVDKGK